ncbi:amidase [Embleya hyalina]|uniref:Amidohydrolase n=1 Tax=Embleya hyalina TaxID=516124 RepID=A0A401YQS2_9ACTN|nr:amidase [Embleya hyalina]GCD96895.1 amidohydrolase [Embleya hyalina]
MRSTRQRSTTRTSPGALGYFAERDLTGLAEDLRTGRSTPEDLVRHTFEAIEALDPTLNAFVAVDEPGALAAARQAGRELRRGVDRGPLHGVPVAVKDLIDVAGLPARRGSAHFRDRVAPTDARCVADVRAAGAVVVGKTTTHELAYGPTGDRSLNGAARNPHDPARMTGGSSGGSAAAVAAGIVPVALGTDTAGSVRIPSALCGIHGFKPAHGALALDGVFPLAPSFDHVGVHARTARDCAIVYRILRGDRMGTPAESVVGTRIGLLDPSPYTHVDARVEAVVRARLEDLVGPVEGVPGESVPDLRRLRAAFVALQGAEAYALHAERVARAPGLFDPEVLERLRESGRVGRRDVARAVRERRAAAPAFEALLARWDVLAMPTVPVVAPEVGARDIEVDGVRVGVRETLLALTWPWNLTGLPALTIPAGSVDGLPVGLQLVGRVGDEERLFAVAEARFDSLGSGHVHVGPAKP